MCKQDKKKKMIQQLISVWLCQVTVWIRLSIFFVFCYRFFNCLCLMPVLSWFKGIDMVCINYMFFNHLTIVYNRG